MGRTMAHTAYTVAPGNRGFLISTAADWLELRVRRAGDCCALKIWAVAGLSLFLAWLPAVSGMPL